MKFLDYSRASIAESISHCYVALDQQYINEEEMVLVNEQANSIWKQVNAFIAYLNQHNKRNHPSHRNQFNQSPQSDI
jgi:four helix bundle protein